MKLIEALEGFRVENLDTDDVLFTCDYANSTSEWHCEVYDRFIHNIKALNGDEGFYKLCNIEMTPEFIKALEDNDTDKYYDDGAINQTLLSAAWLTSNDIDYKERWENEDFDDLYEDNANYQFYFEAFDFAYEYECDIDLT